MTPPLFCAVVTGRACVCWLLCEVVVFGGALSVASIDNTVLHDLSLAWILLRALSIRHWTCIRSNHLHWSSFWQCLQRCLLSSALVQP